MYSHTIAVLEKFDNQHDFERMAADILNSLGYKNVVPIAPRGGSDGGMDITFTTDDGKKGLACVTLRKDIDVKFKEDFSKRSAGEFGIYILFCTAYLTALQKSQCAQHCLNILQAEFVPHDIEVLRSLLDSTLQKIREKYLYVKSEPEGIITNKGLGREEVTHNVSGSGKIRSSNRIERLYLIEKLLQQHSKLRTSELAEKLDVNDDTMRRDLDFLSATGRLPLIKEGWYWKIVRAPVNEKYSPLKIVKQYDYDVALSFAGEDRIHADALADALRHRGLNVFYDKYEKSALWGKNLYTHLSEIYQDKARYCVMFLSKYYAKKLWTKHEREAAQARAFKENEEYILPVRLDNTVIPGIPPTIAYLVWPPETADTVADAIMEKIDKRPLSTEEILGMIGTIRDKMVLILGRFTYERKDVLDAIRDNLPKYGYSPILIDFELPLGRSFTEVLLTLAQMSRFIIADLTDARSIPQELAMIVPQYRIPVQPLLQLASSEYAMFRDLQKYHWLLPIFRYPDVPHLLASLKEHIIEPTEQKVQELAQH